MNFLYAKRSFLTGLGCLALLAKLAAADIVIPELSISTHGSFNAADKFILTSRSAFDLQIQGGSKFSALLKLGFRTNDLESHLNTIGTGIQLSDTPDSAELAQAIKQLEHMHGLEFRTSAISIQNIFSTPLELSMFVGHFDSFVSGDDFIPLFGSKPFATRIKGFMYYPEGIGANKNIWYDGLHQAYGTGFRLTMKGLPVLPYLYAYQDSWLGAGHYSVDGRVLLNMDLLKLEAFAGLSLPVGTMGVYRGGLLFYVDTGTIGSFYAQIGVPYWQPDVPFSLSNMYFLFEPRLQFGIVNLIISLFFHPAYYLQQSTGKDGALDLRINALFGNISVNNMQGGLDSKLSYDPNLASSNIQFELAPYYQLVSSGVRWDFRLTTRLLPFPGQWYQIFAPTIGITTSF